VVVENSVVCKVVRVMEQDKYQKRHTLVFNGEHYGVMLSKAFAEKVQH
jgi:hypothetical protein